MPREMTSGRIGRAIDALVEVVKMADEAESILRGIAYGDVYIINDARRAGIANVYTRLERALRALEQEI